MNVSDDAVQMASHKLADARTDYEDALVALLKATRDHQRALTKASMEAKNDNQPTS